MAGEGKFEVEIIYCVPWAHHGMAAWMANEFIKDTLTDMSDEDIIAIEHTLPEEGVLTFDINEILESI